MNQQKSINFNQTNHEINEVFSWNRQRSKRELSDFIGRKLAALESISLD